MGANQIDTMSKSKKGVPLHYIFRDCRYPYPNIKFGFTSPKEIENIIESLKTKNAYGYDEISVKILKWSAPFISSPLTYLLQTMKFMNITHITLTTFTPH
jgi:hypothetical protein